MGTAYPSYKQARMCSGFLKEYLDMPWNTLLLLRCRWSFGSLLKRQVWRAWDPDCTGYLFLRRFHPDSHEVQRVSGYQTSQSLNMPENQGMSYRTVSTLCNYVHDLLVDQNPLSPVAVLDRSKWHQPVTLDAAPSSSRRLHG